MTSTICILYCCVVIPLLFSLFLIEEKSRKYVAYLSVGATVCLIASFFNGVIMALIPGDYIEIITTYTPICEEILKAIPVLYFAIIFSNNKRELIGIGFALGIGFAILENANALLNAENVTLLWALGRAFSTSLMHGMTTALVGFGIALIGKRKKLFVTGTFSFLTLAIIYHAIFNVFIESDYRWIGIIFPFITFVVLIFVLRERQKELVK